MKQSSRSPSADWSLSMRPFLPVVQTGDTGTIQFRYCNRCSNRAHSYDHALAKAYTSAGAGDCSPMYFVNSWVQMKLSVWPVFYVIITYYMLLLHIITWPVITHYYCFCYYTVVTSLLCIITSIIFTYYYCFCYYTVITSLLRIITPSIITYYDCFVITLLLHHYYI